MPPYTRTRVNTYSIKDTVTAYKLFLSGTYLDDYIPSPGVAAMTPADATVSSITSTDACAKACSKAKSIECKSFEYCENTKSCLLFRGRSFGNATSGATPTCHQFKSKLSMKHFKLSCCIYIRLDFLCGIFSIFQSFSSAFFLASLKYRVFL